MPPAWLPETITIDPNFDKAWADLYQEFRNNILNGHLQLRDHPVWLEKKQDPDGYEELFWHLISKKDETTGDRLFDHHRARKLPWCSAVITNSHEPEVKAWSYMEGKRKTRVYLWLEERDYLIVLEPTCRSNGLPAYYLATAYDTSGASTHKSLNRKYGNRLP